MGTSRNFAITYKIQRPKRKKPKEEVGFRLTDDEMFILELIALGATENEIKHLTISNRTSITDKKAEIKKKWKTDIHLYSAVFFLGIINGLRLGLKIPKKGLLINGNELDLDSPKDIELYINAFMEANLANKKKRIDFLSIIRSKANIQAESRLHWNHIKATHPDADIPDKYK